MVQQSKINLFSQLQLLDNFKSISKGKKHFLRNNCSEKNLHGPNILIWLGGGGMTKILKHSQSQASWQILENILLLIMSPFQTDTKYSKIS